MRLIDAEHLERRLRELGWFEPDEFDREIKLKCILDQEPTAYDVDKVVEHLEKRKKYLLIDFILANKAYEVEERTLARINEIDALVKIVKSDGIE